MLKFSQPSDAALWQSLTERALHAVHIAQDEAISRGEDVVTPGHLLLGLLAGDDLLVHGMLQTLGISADELAIDVESRLGQGAIRRDITHLQLDSRARIVLQQARSEATRLRCKYVGPEHILVGLFAVLSYGGDAVLPNNGAPLQTARNALESLISGLSLSPAESGIVAASIAVGSPVAVRQRAAVPVQALAAQRRQMVIAAIVAILIFAVIYFLFPGS